MSNDAIDKFVDEILAEDDRRMSIMYADYDPVTGENATATNTKGKLIISRSMIKIPDCSIPTQWVTPEMLCNELVASVLKYGSIRAYARRELGEKMPSRKLLAEIDRAIIKIRCRTDFIFWAYVYWVIKNKEGGAMIPFKLSYEQRVALAELEEQRLADEPIRIILLKARQWGGSTLVQIYFAWIQLLHKDGWYSVIVAQTASTSRKIKQMYEKGISQYPSWLLDIDTDVELRFSPYGGSQLDSIITYGSNRNRKVARDAVVSISTYENPKGIPGSDIALIHYSEVALWDTTDGKEPEELVRNISGGLLEAPLTAEVLESTANGTGNFFHTEWERAKAGESGRKAVFIPWHKISRDTKPIAEDKRRAFAKWLYVNRNNPDKPKGYQDSGQYHWYLWNLGATLNGINWYTVKSRGYKRHSDWASQAPSDDVEAFANSGSRVFDMYDVNRLKAGVKVPLKVGELKSPYFRGKECLKEFEFCECDNGKLEVWARPDRSIKVSNRYLAIVDIGGRWSGADYSVIVVLDRLALIYGGYPEVVAQWRGHIDHDLLAWKAAQIATYYNNALLVFESNTLETRDKERITEGETLPYILQELDDNYPNLYARSGKSAEDIKEGAPIKYGYHTNQNTKPVLIQNLIANVRDCSYVERDIKAIDEFLKYEKKDDGSYGAIKGAKDDILMTRAIGLLISKTMDIPKIITGERKALKRVMLSEATI